MSMKINGSYSDYKTDYAEQMKEEKQREWTKRMEKEQSVQNEQDDEKGSGQMSVPRDEYISSEESGVKPSGLYWLGRDENGKPKVLFDAPRKSSDAGAPKVKSDHPEKAAEKCTVNTDKVDREIKKLKEARQQLEQQLRMASGDEKKVRELEKKLAQIESELSQKDNDTYRRQNASVLE